MESISEKTDIFKENEIQANKLVAVALIVTALAVVLVWILFIVDVFDIPMGDPNLLLFLDIALTVVSVGISMRYNYEKRFVKYMLMAVMIFSYAMLDAVFTYYADILMIIPVVLSSRYYKGNYTVKSCCHFCSGISYISHMGSKQWTIGLERSGTSGRNGY